MVDIFFLTFFIVIHLPVAPDAPTTNTVAADMFIVLNEVMIMMML